MRAIMMIRAYRMRGHLHASSTARHLRRQGSRGLHPSSYGFTPGSRSQDLHRSCSVSGVATVNEMVAILRAAPIARPAASSSCTSPIRTRGGLDQEHRGADKTIAFTKGGKRAILRKLIRQEGFEKFIDVKYSGTKRFGLDGGEALSALEQISSSASGNLGVKDRVRHIIAVV